MSEQDKTAKVAWPASGRGESKYTTCAAGETGGTGAGSSSESSMIRNACACDREAYHG